MSECFKSFTYNGFSTKTILNKPLLLATFDRVSTILGLSRDIQKGGTTITRPIANEYGTVANNASIEYCLVKSDFKPFTDEEQIDIERWLTSPKYSTDLVMYDMEDNEVCIYCGLFTNTSWIPHSKGYVGIQFTFECNSAYPFKQYTKTYSITSPQTITVNCESDELNEYVYPILTVEEKQQTAFIDIKNITDDNNTMSIRAYDRLAMTFDCQHCIPTDETTNGVVSYADLGWNDVGNIYWLRLLPGNNELEISIYTKDSEGQRTDITSTADITINYRCPYKLVGGWL